MFKDNAVLKLPSYLNKETSGNIYNLLGVLMDEHDNIVTLYDSILESRDIDLATLSGLDGIGSNVNVTRDGRTDEEYRAAIKLQLAKNSADGTINSIIGILQAQFSIVDPSDIIIIELGNAKISVEVPAESVDITLPELKVLVESIVSTGVGVTVSISGTFTLGTVDGETSAIEGLSNNAETTGGTLGGAIT